MHEQKITWGWALRIIWGVVWRWFAGCVAALAGIALVAAGGQAMGVTHRQLVPVLSFLMVGLWLLALFWAIATALRARHGGYRLILVSGAHTVEAFD
jgi:hypothetical protein